jgi:hypothetical protein
VRSSVNEEARRRLDISRERTAALVVLIVALIAYDAGAARLPELASGYDVAVHSLLVFPAFAAAIWLALPLARTTTGALAAAAAGAGGLALVLTLVGAGATANVAKLACFALVGFAFLTLFEELWWVALVAVLIPWVDAWSVAAGPTRYVVEQRPGIFERISVAFPSPGGSGSIDIGPPDVLFFALFLAAADRFRLRVAWTWIGMTGFLGATLVLIWAWNGVRGLPALPAISLGFLLPNADLLVRRLRQLRTDA